MLKHVYICARYVSEYVHCIIMRSRNGQHTCFSCSDSQLQSDATIVRAYCLLRVRLCMFIGVRYVIVDFRMFRNVKIPTNTCSPFEPWCNNKMIVCVCACTCVYVCVRCFAFLYMCLSILDQRSNHQHIGLQLFWAVLLLAAGFSACCWSPWWPGACFGGLEGRIFMFFWCAFVDDLMRIKSPTAMTFPQDPPHDVLILDIIFLTHNAMKLGRQTNAIGVKFNFVYKTLG